MAAGTASAASITAAFACAAQNGTEEFLFTNQGVNEEIGPSTTVVGSPSFGKVISVRVWVDSNPRDDISPKLETTGWLPRLELSELLLDKALVAAVPGSAFGADSVCALADDPNNPTACYCALLQFHGFIKRGRKTK